MSSLRLSGIATGLDTASIISQLMAVERKPVQLMQTRENRTQAQADAYRVINSKLLAMKTAAQTLMGASQNLSGFAAMTATSSNTAAFTAAVSGTASPGTYAVNVTQTATSQSYGGGAFTPGQTGSFSITGTAGTANINVTATDTAQTIADQVNANVNSSMNATVVGGRLLLSGKGSGTAGNSTITQTSGAAGFITNIGLDPSTNVAGKDAQATVNGIAITSSTNTFKGALSGVDLTAVGVGSGNVTIASDPSTVVNAVKDLVAKFNDLIGTIKTDTAYDPTTKKAGILAGDSFVSGLASQLTEQFTKTFDSSAYNTSGLPGLRNYQDVGMSVQRDGTMTLDSAKLTAALTNYSTQTPGSASVYQLFSFEDSKTLADGTKLNNAGTAGNTTIAQGNTQAGWQGGWGDGIANRIAAFADQMISPSSMYNSPATGGGRYTGALLNRINSLDGQIKDDGKQITAYNLRLENYQRFLQNQFTAMEKSVSKLRSQGSYFSSGGSAGA